MVILTKRRIELTTVQLICSPTVQLVKTIKNEQVCEQRRFDDQYRADALKNMNFLFLFGTTSDPTSVFWDTVIHRREF